MSAAQRTHVPLVALGLALVVFAAFSQFKLPVVLPVLLQEYGYGRVLAGGFMSIFAVFGILLSVPIGRAVARRGALTLVIAALPVMALGTALCLVAPQVGAVMLAGRGLEGAAFCILAVAGPALATANAAPRHRALVIGLIAAWVPSGQLVAALLGPIALKTSGWQGLWVACLLLAGLLAGWTFHALTRGPRGITRHATAQGAPVRWSRAQWIALLLTGSVFMLWTGQYLAYMTWLPSYLVEQQGLSLERALGGYLIPVVLVAVFNLVTGFLLQRGWRAQRLLFGAVAVQAVLWGLLPVTGGGLAGLASLALYGITSGIAPTCLFALSAHLVATPGETARAFGVTMTGRNLGVLGGPLLLALAIESSGGWLAGSLLFTGLTTLALGLAGLLLVMVPRAEPRAPAADNAVAAD
jgi:predicted MFS family arabinose efflux permease